MTKEEERFIGQLWAGVDAGKAEHHCVVIDEAGARLFSKRFANDEDAILSIISDVIEVAGDAAVTWATDLNQGGAALLIALLASHGQDLLYIPGRTIHHAARTYRGDGKTDAKDAGIIADQARMRRDLKPLRAGDATAGELRLLTAHRADLVADKTRTINRMRMTLLEYFPALEAAFDFARRQGPLALLTRYQTPAALRRAGVARVTAWLKKEGHRKAATVAEVALAAAGRQRTVVPIEEVAALIVARLAREAQHLEEQIDRIDAEIEKRLHHHDHAEILLSVPGFGPLLAAEFIGATGDMSRFENADRLAGVAGVAPVPRDSGKVSGNLHRPKRYDRRLLRACFISAQVAARWNPESRAYYERKRAEGKNHKQAVLCLARRRINVIWALLRDGSTYRSPQVASVSAAGGERLAHASIQIVA